MSKEQCRHNQLKGEIASVLLRLARDEQRGRFFPDGYLLSHPDVGLSTNPDGMFVATAGFQTKRVRLVAGAEEGHIELEGTPDMVLEIISHSSVEKDTVELRELYWQAGVREYWLVDGRQQRLAFHVLRRGARGYTAARKQGGWARSAVFQRAFRLLEQADPLGYPVFTLESR